MSLPAVLTQFLASVHPYDSLPDAALSDLSGIAETQTFSTGDLVFKPGDMLAGIYVIADGEIEITDEHGIQLSILGPRNSFGERALLRGTESARQAEVLSDATVIFIPSATFFGLMDAHPTVARFFDRRRPPMPEARNLATMRVDEMMTRDPITCAPEQPISAAAEIMSNQGISSICVVDQERFRGIVTVRDMTSKVVVKGVDPNTPVAAIMTADPLTLGPTSLVTDVLHMMVEQRIGHIPIVDGDTLLGIVTQTDLTRAQSTSSADLVRRVTRATDAAQMARATADIPRLLVQLVDSGNRHEVVTRLITDIADTATRRLLALAEERLGPPPVPYLWLACGSQGRQEQTGVSDQDNCMILSDEVTEAQMPYFEELAKIVSDGLNECGYFYCPGDMMATNPRWRQPLSIWREYFQGWIAKPNPEAQMLASVMFDLRPIGGEKSLFADLQNHTLKAASKNSIFTAHMIANSLKHQPPLGLLRGLVTIRSGDNRNQLDLKHNGVVPVVDLGRIYALQGQLRPVNTHARLTRAIEDGVISKSGGADLLDAYDLIAETRLEHQATQIKAGAKPGNFINPSDLSDFERSHLRDAFVVIKTMQSAVGSGKGALG